MEFEQRESEVLNRPTYIFIGVLILICAIIFFVLNKNDDNSTASIVTLTPEEVAEEREKLRPSNPSVVVSEDTYQDEATETPSEEPKTTSKPPINRISNDDLRLDSTNSVTTESPAIKSIETYDSNEDGNSSVTVTSIPPGMEEKTAEGTIYLRHPEKNQIVVVLANSQGLAGVYVDANTKYILNGKAIGFSDLKDGDSLIVKGRGEIGNSTITASEITVTGFIQATP